MPTRTQINTYLQNNKDRIISYIDGLRDGEGNYSQIKKLDSRDDAAVHVYNGPNGKGFSIVLEATEGSDLYRRSFHFGPEDRPTDTGWQLQIDDEL
jgi:hypothetical protein